MSAAKRTDKSMSSLTSPADESLLTSEDLFGDLLDPDRPPAREPAPARSTRKDPIRVQVGEPGLPKKLGFPAKPLPQEVAALLDAFSESAEAATAEQGTEAVADEDSAVEPLTPSEPLEPPDDVVGTGTKFTAAVAKAAPIPDRPPLDLAGLAHQAMDAVAPVSAPAPETRNTPETAGPTEMAEAPYGPYRLLEKIAIGGMAEVFRAKRTGVEGFEKVVAVKRILPHLSDNQEFVDMFINEAKMVAGLTHPNIVQIFDLGRIEKSYYIAMEYVHGRDLRSILRRAKERSLRIPLDLSVLIVSKVCSALEYAHRKKDDRGRPMKIVHRDISPQNILISFEGDVKLTDFGIAKAATKATATDRGALRGKLLYMSPEQAWGKPIDRRSDLFSLGVLSYEMVTDHKPFLANSEMSILEMVRKCRVTPPTALNAHIPEKLEQVILKALERDPDERYDDAAEMYRDLERVLHARQPPTANELTRFMGVLFDESEREDVVHEEVSPGERSGSGPAELEVDFELSAAPGTPPKDERTDPAIPSDPLSIQKLLKRFGIR